MVASTVGIAALVEYQWSRSGSLRVICPSHCYMMQHALDLEFDARMIKKERAPSSFRGGGANLERLRGFRVPSPQTLPAEVADH